MHISDPGLIALVARGDRDAFAELYDRYGKTAYGLAYRVTRDARARRGGRAGGLPDRLATGRALRRAPREAVDLAALDHAPQGGRRRTPRAAAPHRARRGPSRTRPTRPTSPHEAWLGLQHDQVREALAALPDPQREVIELSYFEGYSQSELARRLGRAARHDQVAHPHRPHAPASPARGARNHNGEPVEHRELQDLIPAHALDALDADDALLLDGHLDTCEECRRELDELRETTALLAFAAAPIEPPREPARADPRRRGGQDARARGRAPCATRVPARRLRRRARRRRRRARDRHRPARPAERRAQLARRARGEPPALREQSCGRSPAPCAARSSATAATASSCSSTCRSPRPGRTYEAWLIGSDKTPVPGRASSRAARRSWSTCRQRREGEAGRDHGRAAPAARSSRRRRRSPARRSPEAR